MPGKLRVAATKDASFLFLAARIICLGCMTYGTPEKEWHTWPSTRSKAGLAKLGSVRLMPRLKRIVFALAQPNLDSPVFFAAALRVVGSDGQGLAKSIYKRQFYSSHLQLVGDYSGPILGKCNILSGPAGVVGETEQEDS